MDGRDLCKINDGLKADRSLWDSMWQEIADNIVFRKASITGRRTPGSKLTNKMYDSTATMCAEDLAAWIHSNLTSMGMEWFSLRMRGMEDDKEVQEALDECKRIQFAAIRDSNFAGEWIEVLNDLVTFCTGAMYFEENDIVHPGFNGLNCIAMSPGTYSIIEGRDGRVQGLFRELELRAQEAYDRWGDEVSDDVKKDVVKNPSKMHTFLHAVFLSKWFGGQHKTQKMYASYYLDNKKKTVMSQGGYDYFPFIVIPWRRESGESYGRGPGWTALPDIKTIHKASELALKEWALSILPPLQMVDQGVIGSVRWTPGGITIVKKDGDLRPMETGARFSDNRLKKEDLKQGIREVFHGDKVKFIPPRNETGQMTAYEVSRRYELANQLLGPTCGNIIFHGLDRFIEATFNMMNVGDAFRPYSDQLPEDVRVEYESPLARSQRMQALDAINGTLEAITPMIELQPDVVDNFKLDDAVRHVAEVKGFPAKLINSEAEKQDIRDNREEAQRQQAELEQAAIAARTAKDAAGAAKELPV